jgi:four helix bundle protein
VLVRCIDSIPANIAEGFGRYHKKDKQKFFYNARGSVYEAVFWLEKAKIRLLIDRREYTILKQILVNLPKEINWLIKITEEKLYIQRMFNGTPINCSHM